MHLKRGEEKSRYHTKMGHPGVGVGVGVGRGIPEIGEKC